jgi:restriction system protein
VLPWWASGIAGCGAYLLLQFAAPAYFSGNVYTAGFGDAARKFAPYALGLFGVIAFLSWLRAVASARRIDHLNGLEDIRKLSWRQFESLVGEAFRRRGYFVLENVKDGADGGVDLVLRKNGSKSYVQCKQWKQLKVGVKPVRELLGVITAGDASGGYFVASGEYTQEARDFASKNGIYLIDGRELERMIDESRAPQRFMDPTSRQRDGADHEASVRVACPTCGEAMVRRIAKRGPKAGSEFWGCSQYPKCRGTRAA